MRSIIANAMLMREGLSGTKMWISALVILIALLIPAIPTMGSIFFSVEHNAPTLTAGTMRTLNISVNNTNTTHNISRVVISLDPAFTYIDGTNQTSAFSTNFSNQTNDAAAFGGKVENLTWGNNTAQGIINATQTEYFLFNVFLPTTASTYNLTVYIYTNLSHINATNVTFTTTGLTSTTGNLSTAREKVEFNWSNSSLEVEANVNGTEFYVDNLYTNISPVYFVTGTFDAGEYVAFDSATRLRCFDVSNDFGLPFLAENTSVGALGFFNRSNLTNENDVRSFTLNLGNQSACPPGLYKGTFAVRNLTNPSSDRIHVPADIHILISENNTLVTANNTAFLKSANTSQAIQSFYFFTNITANITSVTINTSFGQDADLFLLNSSNNLLSKSILEGGVSEEVTHFLPGTPDPWEIRFSNILESFTSYLYFTTVNITNATLTNTSLRTLPFGNAPLDPNETNSSDFRLVNEGGRTADAVVEEREIYRSQEFLNFNTSQKFELLVPNFTTKLEISVQWENDTGNVTDWDLFLNDNTATEVANSTNRSAAANATDLTRTEAIIYTGPFNTSFDGIWNISIINNSYELAKNYYNVTALVFLNATHWLNTTYNASTNFNVTGAANSSYTITATITVPRTEILNGSYGGTLTYHNNSGWKLKLPLSFQVLAGHLLVDNNLSLSTVSQTNNTGTNRTVLFNVTVNNTGGHAIWFENTTSANGTLFLTTDSSKFMNFTIDNPHPNPLPPGVTTLWNLSVVVDTNTTANTPGLYKGWVFFNTSNTTNLSSSSYPFSTFNLSVEINLTDRLNTNITKLVTGYTNFMRIENTSKENNITMEITARILNGTLISTSSGDFDLGDFFSPKIIERNTSTTYTPTNITFTPTGQECDSDTCDVNVTAPAHMIGGRYQVSINVRWNTSQSNLTGTAFNRSLIVNNTGINLSAPSSTSLGSISEATGVTYLNVTVGNLGPLKAIQTDITLNIGACPITVTAETSGTFSSSCSISTSSNPFTITVDPNTPIEGGCALRWKLAAKNVSGTDGCTGADAINVTANRASFNNITGITLTVTETGGGSSSDDSSGGSGGSSVTCTTDAGCGSAETCSGGTCTALSCNADEYTSNHACVKYDIDIDSSYPSDISLLPGESTTTTISVSEASSKTTNVKLSVITDAAVNASTTVETCDTPCDFTVSIIAEDDAEIGIFDSTFKAFASFAEDASESKSFTLNILPTEEKKVEIEDDYLALLPLMTDLQKQFDTLKGQLPPENLTELSALVDEMNDLSAQIQTALDEGDFLKANDLVSQLDATILSLQEKFANTTVGPIVVGDLLIWIIIIIIIIGVAILLVYMLLPSRSVRKGFAPKKKFNLSLPSLHRKKKPTWESVKRTYASGYSRQKLSSYGKESSSNNPLNRFKKKKK